MVPLRNRYQKKVFKYGTPNPEALGLGFRGLGFRVLGFRV